ncbi:MAG: polysaccharide deacetylase family protein [Gemmatimonadota bacterium]|nr:polysaccharide deacetylase family protein [Gemmatimonadota bacterium]MDH3423227.1 polysaccharide deacetylase family protein [Gemmatimonadota bacterium]
MEIRRDLVGYAQSPPDIRWPGGARMAVNFVLNYEEGSEYSLEDGDGHSDAALTEVAQPRVPRGDRDLAAESMFEYGSRVGFWRLYRLFRDRGLPVTVFASALALERNPAAAQAVAESGWDVVAHGRRWVEHYLLDEETERAEIADAFDSIHRLVGRPPEGWYCRYAPSPATRKLLVEHGGFTYDSDAYNDELPYWVWVADRPHLVVPYSLVTNDAKLVGGPLVTGRAFGEFLIDAFEELVSEAAVHARMMSVGMHARILGQPGRIVGLRAFLDHVQGRNDVWICRRGDLAAHWRAHVPPAGAPRCA